MDHSDGLASNLPPNNISMYRPATQHNGTSHKTQSQHSNDADAISLASINTDDPSEFQQHWDARTIDIDATARAPKKQTLRSRLRHVKSCLTPAFIRQRTSRGEIDDSASFNGYARKQSSRTTTTVSTFGASTVFDDELDLGVAALPMASSQAYEHQPRRQRSSACLSRLGTRVFGITRCGFAKVQTHPDEKAARRERKLQEKKERVRRVDNFEDHDYDGYQARFAGQGRERADWKMSLAFMSW